MAVLLALLLDLAAFGPSALTAEPLRGPFPSVTSACTTLRSELGLPLDDRFCASSHADECPPIHSTRAVGPFAEMRLVRVTNMCYVAVRVDRGWYVGETSLAERDRQHSEVDRVEADGARVALHVANYYWWHDEPRENESNSWYDLRRAVIVCGLARGVPACTPELVLGWSPRWEEEGGDPAPHLWRWRYDARLDGGALVVRRRIDAPRVAPSPFTLLPQPPRTGRYALPF